MTTTTLPVDANDDTSAGRMTRQLGAELKSSPGPKCLRDSSRAVSARQVEAKLCGITACAAP